MEDASRPDLSCELVHDYPNPVGIGLLVGLLGGEDVALQRVAPIVLGDAAVVHDIANKTQRFFSVHTDIITALKPIVSDGNGLSFSCQQNRKTTFVTTF